jgi:thiamine biosynthesis protein ThiI
MRGLILVKYGEIALKGKNRSYFEQKLVSNIKSSLYGLTEYKVSKEHGRVFIEHDVDDYDEISERVSQVFGIVSISPGIVVENDLDVIKVAARKQVEELLEEKGYKTFKVECRRPNKSFPFKSPEISKHIGGYVNQSIDAISVDVHEPEFSLNIEVRDKTYIYCKSIECFGGMPYGTSGKGMLLLSGGIDSPVAGFMMARRGVEISAVHFHSYPFTSDRAKEKVMDLAKILCKYTGKVVVHNVNLLEIQKEIGDKCPEEEMTILSRRFMMAIAEKLAIHDNCQALITGENIAQVASQTIEGLTVTNARVNLPVFRPLIAYDKNDIIKVAKNIGTFETSILPFEDCCTVFLPKKVVTKPKLHRIEKSESKLDGERLIETAIENRETVVFRREELF